MTVTELITGIKDRLTDASTFSDQTFIDWVNELEADIYTRIIKKYDYSTIDSVADQGEYNYPASVSIDDIERLIYKGMVYYKVDIRTDSKDIHNPSFWDDDGEINMFPVPKHDDEEIKVVYLTKPTSKTLVTDELLLPNQFINAYRYYIYAQILLLRDEDSRVEKWMMQFNEIERKLVEWYPAPLDPISQLG